MKKLPTHLLIVACAFLLIGAIALWQSINSLFYSSRPVIDFFVVFILIGAGLLRGNEQSRGYALACSLVMLVFQIAAVVLIILGKRTAGAQTSAALFFWFNTGLTIAASGYALWVLQSAPVRRIFNGK